MTTNNKKELYSWSEFGEDAKKLANLIKKSGVKFDSVWGPARGGLPIAVSLSHALDLPLVATPGGKSTLIVDDIADTGKTLKNFADQGYFIATLYYHKQSQFVPSIWLKEKKNDWVAFPWEVA
ncbi:MAG: phosphoribosyltransferase [Candidatus Liptonbacteria bacterium]|nr:phosphoribosyltransferase [Candidatus Liptonbacteria bacterium]